MVGAILVQDPGTDELNLQYHELSHLVVVW